VREIAWKAQCRLSARYRALTRKGKLKTVAVTAVAREPSALILAINRQNLHPPAGAREKGFPGKRRAVTILFMEPTPGQRSGDVTYRATAGAKPRQGNSSFLLCGRSQDRRPIADTGQPQTNIRTCGSNPRIRA